MRFWVNRVWKSRKYIEIEGRMNGFRGGNCRFVGGVLKVFYRKGLGRVGF